MKEVARTGTPAPPSQPSPNKPAEPPVLGMLSGADLLNYREATSKVRQLQRDLERANLTSAEVLEGIRKRHRNVRWAKIATIDEDTGELLGKA